MQLYIYSLSYSSLFFSCFFVLVIFSILGLFVVKRFNVNSKIADNSAIMPIMYIIGSIYAIVLGMFFFQAIIHLQHSQRIVEQESAAIMKTSYDIKILAQNPNTSLLNDTLIKYINNVIELEWPAMSQSKHDNNNELLLDKMATLLLNYNTTDANQQIIINNTYYDMVELAQLRQKRFEITTHDIIPIYEWVSLACIMSIILIASMCLALRFKLQILMLLLLIIIFSTIITLIIKIDAPFIGVINTKPSKYMIDLTEPYPVGKFQG